MRRERAGLWGLCCGLVAATALAGIASADPLGMPPPDLPAVPVLDGGPAAGPAPAREAAIPDLPAPPAVAVALPAGRETSPAAVGSAAAPVHAASEPAASPTETSPNPAQAAAAVPESVQPVAPGDPVSAAVQALLADPKLQLPPKLGRRDRDALSAFYAARGFKPLWVADGDWSGAAAAVASRLERADEDGLDAADYPVPRLRPVPAPPSASDLAEADLKLSADAVLYARDARGGRLDPSRLSALITPKLELPAADAVLSALADSAAPGDVLEGYNPAYPGYRRLKSKLAEIRANRPAGPMARRDGRSGLTRQAVADLGPGSGLAARVPPVASARLEGDIVANMERWRWLPAAVPARSVDVNIPEYRLRVLDHGRVVHETRVITGKAATPTPIFTGLMEYAIVNPSWFIPPSILKKEILPGLARDPDYAARRGYEVVRRGRSVSVRQPPGAGNALGYIKFMFPNDHAVYLHDTPSRGLFSAGTRAFSHGCVRVEHPFALGGAIMGGSWTEGRLQSLVGRGERTVFLAEKLPVNLTYFTVSVDELGQVRSFDDVYGYNRRVRAALGLGA